MEKQKKLSILGRILLLLATLVWGSSFVILKDTISQTPPMYVIAIRFLFSGLVMCLVFFKRLKNLSKLTLLSGVVVGLFLSGAYITQTYGLMFTTPGRNAFLTAAYCVMSPFLVFFLFKQKIKPKNIVCAIICIVGIGLISLSGSSQQGASFLGDGLSLASAVFFALQIVFTEWFARKNVDLKLLLAFQLLVVGVVIAVISLIFELPKGIGGYSLNLEQIINIAYLTLFCTLFAQTAQAVGIKYTTSNQAALILSLESVFGMIFSVICGKENLTLLVGIGFAVVFVAIVFNELDFKTLLNKKEHRKGENYGKQEFIR